MTVSFTPFMCSLHRLNITVLDGNKGNTVTGYMAPVYTGNGDSLAPNRDLASWCLNFNGTVITTSGAKRKLTVGKTYRLRAFVEGPLAAGDAALGKKPTRQRVCGASILKPAVPCCYADFIAFVGVVGCVVTAHKLYCSG